MTKEGSVHVNLVLPRDLWKRLRKFALDEDRSASDIVADLVRLHLDKKVRR